MFDFLKRRRGPVVKTAMPGSNPALAIEIFFFMKMKLNQMSMTVFEPKSEWFRFHLKKTVYPTN